MTAHECLQNRRAAETFEFECASPRYTCTTSRYANNRIAEIFLSNHKSNSAADTGARDAAIAFLFAVQHGADPEANAWLCAATLETAPTVRWASRSISLQSGNAGH